MDGEHSSSNETISSIISSDSSTDDNTKPIKRYKRYLDADYKEHEVSSQTRRKWSSVTLEKERNSSIHIPDEGTLLHESADIDQDMRNHSNIQLDDNNENVNGNSFEMNTTIYSDDCSKTSEIKTDVESVESSQSESILGDNNFIPRFEQELNNRAENGNDLDVESNYSESSLHFSELESNLSSICDSDDNFNENDLSFFNDIMFECSNITIRDVIIMISAFSLRYKLSDEARLEYVEMIKVFAGKKFQNLKLSKYMMTKCFSSQEKNIDYHYYCKKCSKEVVYSINAQNKLNKLTRICKNCNAENLIAAASPNYFISINLEYQLRQLLSNNDIFENVLENYVNNTNSCASATIKDVSDGKIFKKIMESFHPKEENALLLTLNFNTDGAPMTKSGKRGFWPVQATLNNLSPKLRFRFIILTGILVVANEPKSNLLNLFLDKVFMEQINKLHTEGMVIEKNGIKYLFKCCPLSCTVDSVCRPIIQNRLQFNGYSGCSWCYILGMYIHAVHGIRYVFEQNATCRTNDSHKKDVINATCNPSASRGVRGSSCFSNVPHFDMVWSFAYEYMHSLLLGVTHQMWNQWKNGKGDFKISKKEVEDIEEKYLFVTPTHDVHRLPRAGILKGSSKPKASELKNWLLISSLPCLNGVLPEEALIHYALLVKCAYVLLKQEISEDELIQCEKDLITFVCYYEMYYGVENMSYNVHSLLHIVDSVRQTGPLYTNSAFPYESYIYSLKNYITGPKGMDRQMSRKHLQTFLFKTENTSLLTISRETINYCHKLFVPKRLLKNFKDAPNNVTYFGKSCKKKVKNMRECTVYNKCIFNGNVYHSLKYKRVAKTDDTVVQLQCGKFGQIIDIADINDQCYFHLRLFKICQNCPFEGVNHIKKIDCELSDTLLTSSNNVKQKIIYINIKNERYLCSLPNTVEIQ